jgi:steroid delta-isomerase-like uncharacterized protein
MEGSTGMPDRRQLLMSGLMAGGGLAVSGLRTSSAEAAPSGHAARETAERFASTLTAHDMAAFAALFSDQYINHQQSAATPATPGRSSKEGTVAFFGARLAGLPDLDVSIEALVASGDRVAASFLYTGTHNGTWYGVAPTGRRLRFTSCDIFDVKDGLIVEHWGMGDTAGILAQLKA